MANAKRSDIPYTETSKNRSRGIYKPINYKILSDFITASDSFDLIF